MATEARNFVPGSKVLAYHGPLVYEAKVLKYHMEGLDVVDIEEEKTEPLVKNKIPAFLLDKNAYFLHYKGWNPKWDEWVSSERIIEFNNDNLGLSRELRNARKKTVERLDSGKEAKAEAAERKSRRGKKKNSAVENVSKKHGSDIARDQPKPNATGRKKQKSESHPGYSVMLPFSPNLKCVMVDDWELVTKDSKLVNLETATPVVNIIKDYHEWKQEIQSAELMRTTNEALNGLKILFDQTFGLDLLYKFERLQYSNLLRTRENVEPSKVYGCEHLLRLLITLPGRIAQTNMDAISVNIMMGEMKDLLDYIDANMDKLASSYMNVTSQYDRMARV